MPSGQVDSGTWIYSGDPLASDRDEVRFLVGDTQAGDQLLSDEEINAALAMSAVGARGDGACSTSTLAVNGAHAAGATIIDLDATTVTGSLFKGTTFTIAGDTTRYRVTAEVEASGNAFADVEILPGLTAAAADNAVVTVRFSNVYEAAALCCESLARRFAREPDVTIDGKTVSYSQRASAFMSAARQLRAQSSRGAGVGGVMLERV